MSPLPASPLPMVPLWRKDLARAVSRRRARAGLSQRQLARRAGVYPSAVGAVETARVVGDPVLVRLARALECWPAAAPEILARSHRLVAETQVVLDRSADLLALGRGRRQGRGITPPMRG